MNLWEDPYWTDIGTIFDGTYIECKHVNDFYRNLCVLFGYIDFAGDPTMAFVWHYIDEECTPNQNPTSLKELYYSLWWNLNLLVQEVSKQNPINTPLPFNESIEPSLDEWNSWIDVMNELSIYFETLDFEEV